MKSRIACTRFRDFLRVTRHFIARVMRKNAKILEDWSTTRSKVKQTARPSRDAVFKQLCIPLGSNPTGACHHAPQPRARARAVIIIVIRPPTAILYRIRRGRRKSEEKEETTSDVMPRWDAVRLHAIARSACEEKRGRLVGRSVGQFAVNVGHIDSTRARAPYWD